MGLILNVACGSNLFPKPWVNTDHVDMSEYIEFICRPPIAGMPPEQVELCNRVREAGGIDFMVHDMMTRFPYADGSCDFIYLGQAIEHINPVHEVPRLLAEFWRLLKPGGILKMTTPDLERLLRAYWEGDMGTFADDQPSFYREATAEDQLAYIMYGASGAGSTSKSYEGHHHLYTPGTLTSRLNAIGFTNISELGHAHSLLGEVDKGMSHSFALGAEKPR